MINQLLEDHDFNLWVRFHQTSDMMLKVRDNELSKYDSSSIQAMVLFVIKLLHETKGKATPGEISKWLFREPHSVSRILIRMENDGLLNRVNCLNKKNEKNVILTEKGEHVYSQTLKRESIREIMSCLSKEEHQQLSLLLEKIQDKTLQTVSNSNKRHFPWCKT